MTIGYTDLHMKMDWGLIMKKKNSLTQNSLQNHIRKVHTNVQS